MSTSPYARSLAPVSVAIVLAALPAATLRAESVQYDGTIGAPALDRWMYPYNMTPGSRPTISTFGSTPGDTVFDSRDGQMLVAFDTDESIPTGLGADRYQILSMRLTVQFANDLVVQYDPSSDPWQCFLDDADPQWQADPDAGQPLELFGVGFRNGFSAATFAENSPFTVPPNGPMTPGARNAFAMSFDPDGAAIDVSSNPRQGFDPKVWATGVIDDLAPGEPIPGYALMHFDLDATDSDIQQYLRQALDAGRLHLALTSLTFVVQQGGDFPTFFTKENALVSIGVAQAATLEFTVQVQPLCASADFNCDGAVDGDDLGTLLGFWGDCAPPCPADLNGDGAVDGDDLGSLLGAWSN